MAFWSWSKTAGSNDVADATVNWAEGQAPSTVNNSARAMMAALAAYRDDEGAALVTAGGPNNYTLATNQVFNSLSVLAGKLIAFVPNVSCGSPVLLNVDTLGLKPLRSAPSVELLAGQIIQGTPCAVSYNNVDGAFYLYNAPPLGSSVPLGTIMPYAGSTAPSGSFALCLGQAISRTTFASLFSLIGTTYGTGAGGSGTTFGLPDLRGRVIAGLDQTNGVNTGNRITSLATDGGTIVGTTLGSVGGSQNHVLAGSELANHGHTITGQPVSAATVSGQITTDHLHQVPAVIAGGGLGTLGLAAGNFTGNTFTSNADRPLTVTAASVSGQTVTGGTDGVPGSNNPFAMLQPTIILPYIIRVL
jgi:microcystin-dependent protein